MKNFRLIIALLGLTASGLATAAELPLAEPVKSVSPAYDRYLEMDSRIKELRKAGDTDGLEVLAAELRTSKEALDGGTWLLSHFYKLATLIPDTEPEAGEAMEFFEFWARERPENITAQVCLAKALTRYAWTARGTGWAKDVTPEGWRLMEERLDHAWEVLERAGQLEASCPGWYEVGQTVGLGQGWDRDDYLAFVQEAIEHEPSYGRYYTSTCYWLLPRWHGEEGDFERWIAKQANAQPSGEQDWQYARLVWMADLMPVKNQVVFGPEWLDWERTKAGFETWLATAPEDLNVRFQFTRLALLAGDRETSRAQFDVTGGKYLPGMWKGVEEFEQARRFAYEGGVNPLAVQEPDRKPQRKISPEAIARVALILRVTGGLLGGAMAGVCLLVLAMQRRETVAGVVTLFSCLVAGAAFGTLATLVPAAIFYLFLRRKNFTLPPEISPPSGWIVLVWVIVIGAAFLVLPSGALLLAIIPTVMENAGVMSEDIVISLTRDGTIFKQITMGGWLCFLGLLIACRPQNREGWQRKLGLHGINWKSATLWTLGIGVAIWGTGYFFEEHMDERTREAIDLIYEGKHSPFWFFLAMAVVAPVNEELLFRGYAYSGWVNKLGVRGAILLPAVLFTICHFQYGWVGLIFVFLMGLGLGILRWKTRSIYPCLALHMVNNLSHWLAAIANA